VPRQPLRIRAGPASDTGNNWRCKKGDAPLKITAILPARPPADDRSQRVYAVGVPARTQPPRRSAYRLTSPGTPARRLAWRTSRAVLDIDLGRIHTGGKRPSGSPLITMDGPARSKGCRDYTQNLERHPDPLQRLSVFLSDATDFKKAHGPRPRAGGRSTSYGDSYHIQPQR